MCGPKNGSPGFTGPRRVRSTRLGKKPASVLPAPVGAISSTELPPPPWPGARSGAAAASTPARQTTRRIVGAAIQSRQRRGQGPSWKRGKRRRRDCRVCASRSFVAVSADWTTLRCPSRARRAGQKLFPPKGPLVMTHVVAHEDVGRIRLILEAFAIRDEKTLSTLIDENREDMQNVWEFIDRPVLCDCNSHV